MIDLKDQIINYLNVVIREKVNLKEYALKNNIPILINGNLDKGWKGNVVEHLLNLKKNNKKGADFESLEIKTVPVIYDGKIYKVKETTCLSILETNDIIKNSFEKSSLYKKVNKTLFILIDVSSEETPMIINTYYLDFNKNERLKREMEKDYNMIAEHIYDNISNDLPLAHNFTGKLGNVIQPRPKTGKKGSYTWAFYLKSHVLTNLLNGNPNKAYKLSY